MLPPVPVVVALLFCLMIWLAFCVIFHPPDDPPTTASVSPTAPVFGNKRLVADPPVVMYPLLKPMDVVVDVVSQLNPAPVAVMVMEPAPLVIEIPDPAVKFAATGSVLVPIRSCPVVRGPTKLKALALLPTAIAFAVGLTTPVPPRAALSGAVTSKLIEPVFAVMAILFELDVNVPNPGAIPVLPRRTCPVPEAVAMPTGAVFPLPYRTALDVKLILPVPP